jgi:fructose-1,6-bisphosphatase/inositol monophosphatase family enzyme
VAGGRFDGFVDCSADAHGSWDYLAGMLICEEAGALVADPWQRPLVTLEHSARRTPVAAGTKALLDQVVEARLAFPDRPAWASEDGDEPDDVDEPEASS